MEYKKATHKVEVVPIKLESHPTADRLSIVKVHGYQVCAHTESWKDKFLAAYIPPDSLVDTRRIEFDFLANEAKYKADSSLGGPYHRIKMKKLRGEPSFGMLCPVPEGAMLGDDVADQLGVLHYEPPIPMESTKGPVVSGPALYSPKYDVDNLKQFVTEKDGKYISEMFDEGEPVVVTEKIHGASARYVYHNGQIFCGSRNEWKGEYEHRTPSDEIRQKLTASGKYNAEEIEAKIAYIEKKPLEASLWWKALRNTPHLEDWLRSNPNIIVYGEVYGQIQKGFPYDAKGSVKVVVFDLLQEGKWLDYGLAGFIGWKLPWVPEIATQFPFDFAKLKELATGKSILAGGSHIREGVVVSPTHERSHVKWGRVKLKVINPAYLEKDFD